MRDEWSKIGDERLGELGYYRLSPVFDHLSKKIKKTNFMCYTQIKE